MRHKVKITSEDSLDYSSYYGSITLNFILQVWIWAQGHQPLMLTTTTPSTFILYQHQQYKLHQQSNRSNNSNNINNINNNNTTIGHHYQANGARAQAMSRLNRVNALWPTGNEYTRVIDVYPTEAPTIN